MDKFPGCQYKGFNSQAEATSYIAGITLMKRQQRESETPKQRATLNVPSHTSKPWHTYEDEQERRYLALGSRNPKKSTARIESYSEPIANGWEIVDVEDDVFGTNDLSPSNLYVIDDRPTQVLPTSAKRPSPGYPDDNRKKARTMEREVIDLTDSPPKNRSRYQTTDAFEFVHSPASDTTTSSEGQQFGHAGEYALRNPAPQHYDANSRNGNGVPRASSNHYRSSRSLSPTSAEDLAFLLQPQQSLRQSNRQNKSDIGKGNKRASSHFTSVVDKPISSVPFTTADCSPQQKRILDLVSEGKNVFFTGSAGVGKSFVLNKICEQLKSQGMKQFSDFFMTASTGIAAVQIGGMTLHSFAGTGKGEDGVIQLKKQCARNKRVSKHWKNCKILIIDEVSMVRF